MSANESRPAGNEAASQTSEQFPVYATGAPYATRKAYCSTDCLIRDYAGVEPVTEVLA